MLLCCYAMRVAFRRPGNSRVREFEDLCDRSQRRRCQLAPVAAQSLLKLLLRSVQPFPKLAMGKPYPCVASTMRSSLICMYLVQTAAFAAKRLARRGVALHSTAAYDALTKELREVARLEEVSGILSYDEQCFMSEGSAASRAAQKEALAGVIHEKRTSARMAEVIDAARGLKLDDARENANVRDAIEGFDVESRKSKDLAEREARLESECFVATRRP